MFCRNGNDLAIRHRRYVITDLAMALKPEAPSHERLATGVSLYTELADFALRARGHWVQAAKRCQELS
ncbi:hypothetical protein J2W42_006584 [Rhizobium tibeticum]|uniref:hypothetical protein n=1 Tax=Rhizobium tibeticum TaxID=501024 RepID=UPI00277F0ECA|nr:hypothetical protein [Rhizobium tibeticum]MDP9813709.1 hypothetical protein [Rhizobium tibeticum]